VPTATLAPADVCDERGIERAVAQAWSRAPVDLLVTSAGTNSPGPLIEVPVDSIRSMVDVNVVGTLLSCRAFARALVGDGERRGAIVTVSSQMGAVGHPDRVTYWPPSTPSTGSPARSRSYGRRGSESTRSPRRASTRR
jgi:short-subunit dehydrogenase